MDFEIFLKRKNGHFAYEGLQKSRFRIDEYSMLIGTDFGWILGRSGGHFWKENRSKIDIEIELYSRALGEARNYRPGENPARPNIIEEAQFLAWIP